MIETLDDFIDAFNIIKESGWIRTHRSGTTGVGKTLEDLLEIPENNNSEPDFGDYELKSCRLNSNSMLTMFTLAPQPARSNTYLRETFGYSSDAYNNDRKVLHSTLTASRLVPIQNTGFSLGINCQPDKILIRSNMEMQEVYWTREAIQSAFERKYVNSFVYAKAQSRGNGADEEFYFCEAYEMSGFSYESMMNLLEEGRVYIDLRIGQYPAGNTHDHGTGFRIKEVDLSALFTARRIA